MNSDKILYEAYLNETDNIVFEKNDCLVQITHQRQDGSLKRKLLKANVNKSDKANSLELTIKKRLYNNDHLTNDNVSYEKVAFEQKSMETKDTLKRNLIDNLSFKPTDEDFFEYLDNKHLCFDIGGRKHNINLEINGNEAKITSIKDYQKLLYLLQKWERKNHEIISKVYSEKYNPTTYGGENVDSIIKQISNDSNYASKSLKKYIDSTQSLDLQEDHEFLGKNLENYSSSYKNSREDDAEYELPVNYRQTFLSREEILNSRKNQQNVQVDKDKTQETLRKFDKENQDQFEWFIDNVFQMSDIESFRSEKNKGFFKNTDKPPKEQEVLEKITERSIDKDKTFQSNMDRVSIDMKTKEILLDPKTKNIIDNMRFEEDEKIAELEKKATVINRIEKFLLCFCVFK